MPANPDPGGDQPDSLLVIMSRDKREKRGESPVEVSRRTCLETVVSGGAVPARPQLSPEGSVLWVGEIRFGHGCAMGNPDLSLRGGSSARVGVSREGV